MNKEKIIWLKIKANSYYNLFIKLNEIGITIYDNYKDKDYIHIKTTYSDYKKLKKYLVSYDIIFDDVTGLSKLKQILKKYQVFTLAVIISIFLLFMVNSLIFRIDIKSSNKNIQNLLRQELEKNGLKKFSFKKNHSEIEKIVNKILDNNKNTLEWFEIKYDGLVMVVNVTEKTKINKEKNYSNCNIVATKDAKILNINLYRGVSLKEINDYVLKDEVIISGSITYNEEVKNNVCASGEVFGEVWYKVKVTVPFKETYLNYTGNNRYNLGVKINDQEYTIFKSRIKKKKNKNINLYKLNDFEINLIKEKEYEIKTHELSENEAFIKANELAINKVNLRLNDEEEILYKKVLKNEVNDSTIYVELFIVTKEKIGKMVLVEEEISSDNKSSNESN